MIHLLYTVIFFNRQEQMEFLRDCPTDPNTSSYFCLGFWEEESRNIFLLYRFWNISSYLNFICTHLLKFLMSKDKHKMKVIYLHFCIEICKLAKVLYLKTIRKFSPDWMKIVYLYPLPYFTQNLGKLYKLQRLLNFIQS